MGAGSIRKEGPGGGSPWAMEHEFGCITGAFSLVLLEAVLCLLWLSGSLPATCLASQVNLSLGLSGSGFSRDGHC